MVRVDMRLQEKVKKFLKTDGVASIGSDGLMGDKLIVIAPGFNGEPLLANKAQIPTVSPVDFDKVIAKFTKIADNAEVITASLASISSQISGGKGSLGKLIYTDDLQRGLVGTVTSAQKTMESAKEAIGTVKKGVEGFSENMEAVKHNVLVRGYFKKKEKKARKRAEDSTNAAQNIQPATTPTVSPAPLPAPDAKSK